MSAGIVDRILKQNVNDINLTLYSEDGEVVANWDSNGTDYVIEGLEPGKYQLEIGGRASTRKTFEVKDTGSLQYARVYTWTILDAVLLITGIGVLALAIFIAVRLIRRKKKVKNGE